VGGMVVDGPLSASKALMLKHPNTLDKFIEKALNPSAKVM
jgi:hypothetical protein